MKKFKIVGIVLLSIILIGLIAFASTHKYEDTHLRKEGVRVKVDEYALNVEDCDEGHEDDATCEKTLEVGNKEAKFLFEFKDFEKNGLPKTFVATINGHEFLKNDTIDFTQNNSGDYQFFLNFHVIDDKYIMFTYTDGALGLATTLYVIDLDGKIILEEKELDTDSMLIKDYSEFFKYDEETKTATVIGTRLVENTMYHDASVCDADRKIIVEAKYTYTYKNGEFVKKQIEPKTADDYLKEYQFSCRDED